MTLRLAKLADVAPLRVLITASVNGLQAGDYSAAQRAGALGSVFGVDTRLIADGTYFVVETADGRLAACGGWSRFRTLFGADAMQGREDSYLDPAVDAARIRAFFVHPEFARRGLGSRILQACEQAAREAGFWRFELGATLTGVPLYERHGYREIERLDVALGNGETLPIIRMAK
ncbi:MAG: GNAT family N-acetyltransferase [Bryobacterales bacterium]|nr:GNAT family N-acetyltransferase [Bryobacterales bacterium]